MTDRPENTGHQPDSQSTLGLVAEWLGMSTPAPKEKTPDRPLYGSDGAASIKPSAVIQGEVNDCFFMAPVAALAQHNQHFLSDAIKDNKDGSYTVTFAGDKSHPVTVPAPTADELQKYAKVGANGIWPAVLEKGFGTYLKDNPDQRDKILGHSAGWFLHDPEQFADNGKAAAVFKLLTGYEPSGIKLSDGHIASGVKDMLASSFNAEKPEAMVAGIAEDNKTALQMGLLPGHDYTVLGYANGMVTIRDPYGKTQDNALGRHMPGRDGVFTMKVDDFARAFDEVLEARTRPMFDGGAIMINRMPRLK